MKKGWRVDLRLLQWWDDLSSSYWFWPSAAAFGAVIFSSITLYLDHEFAVEWSRWMPSLSKTHPEGARAFLSTVSGSIITVTGVILSMTILTVSTASTQYSPRLLANYMKNKSIQLALATFISTFIYCLMILRNIFSEQVDPSGKIVSEGFVPQLSVFVAFLLTLFCVIVLINFFHQVPQSIRLTNIVCEVGERLIRRIDALFDVKSKDLDQSSNHLEVSANRLNREEAQKIRAQRAGYVQTVDHRRLISQACESDSLIDLQVKPGEFVSLDQVIGLVQCKSGQISSKELKRLSENFVIGAYRTETQDYLFLAEQLVEVAVKALSPGVNDPNTATAAMNWIQNAIIRLSTKSLPSPLCFDEEQCLRLISNESDGPQIIRDTLGKLNAYVASDAIASRHLMAIYRNLYFSVELKEQKVIVELSEELGAMVKEGSLPSLVRVKIEEISDF